MGKDNDLEQEKQARTLHWDSTVSRPPSWMWRVGYLQEINHNNGLIIQKIQVDINEPVVDLPDVVYHNLDFLAHF